MCAMKGIKHWHTFLRTVPDKVQAYAEDMFICDGCRSFFCEFQDICPLALTLPEIECTTQSSAVNMKEWIVRTQREKIFEVGRTLLWV